MKQLVLLFGSNFGDSKRLLDSALDIFTERLGAPLKTSSIYTTEPWGLKEQPYFLNRAAVLSCNRPAEHILALIHEIEKTLGRTDHGKWNRREIDIDIIFYGTTVTEQPGLKIPHPLMHDRKFVLVPLAEIIPEFRHPLTGDTVRQMLESCRDTSTVEQWKDI